MPINPAPGHFSTSQYKSILFEAKIACIENIAKIQHRQLNYQSHTCHHCDMLIKTFDLWWLNSLRPRRNGRYNADDIFKCIFLKENVCIPTKISLKFVPKGPINNIPALVKIMAWRRPGDKPFSEPMLIFVPTHICVTFCNISGAGMAGWGYNWPQRLDPIWLMSWWAGVPDMDSGVTLL